MLDAIEALGKEAHLRKLFPKVIKQLSQEEIILALNALDREGKIKIEDGGDISYLLKPRAKKPSSAKKDSKEFTLSPSNSAKATGNPKRGERFMSSLDPRGELAPRDVVAFGDRQPKQQHLRPRRRRCDRGVQQTPGRALAPGAAIHTRLASPA